MLLLLGLAGPRERLDDKVFDLFQRLHPRDLTDMRVAVVAIDSDSLKSIGPWPWSRYDLARLTERIGAAGARAIGYDMFFPEPDKQAPSLFVGRYPELSGAAREAVLALPSLDEDFAGVLGRFPTVLARAGVGEQSVDFDERAYADAGKLPVEAVFPGPLPGKVTTWQQAISNIPAIEEQSAGHGLVNGDPDDDGVVRRIQAVGSLKGTANIGFAAEIARVAAALDEIGLRSARGSLTGVTIGSHTIPVAADGRYRLHYGQLPGRSIISAADLFRRGFDRRLVAGKSVVVGLTGAGTVDIVSTPLEARYPGPFVQTQAVDAIERGGWLERPRWALAAELGAGVALVLAVLLFVARIRGAAALAIAAIAATLTVAIAWFAFVGAGLLIDPLTPLLIGGISAASAFIALYRENAFVQLRLRVALMNERLSAAKAVGELEAARKIQSGMLATGAQLAALDARIDLDARLEPAREIGGDFYDAFALPDGRILFLVGDVTGKGVPAALFMALSKALARSAIERHLGDLGAAVATLAIEMSRDNSEDMFVTLLVGAIDPADGALTMVNAGHENPLVRRADGSVEELVMVGGPPVCTADDFPYEAERFTLAPGDGLIVVTDGVTEAQNATGGFLDRAGAIAVFEALPADWRADQATGALMQAVRAFENGTEPSDDLTVLALRRPVTPVSAR
jgi:serine phosphatase RsbU (regulator of sigma subunit)/CHASE2 domain-containing sensor protein